MWRQVLAGPCWGSVSGGAARGLISPGKPGKPPEHRGWRGTSQPTPYWFSWARVMVAALIQPGLLAEDEVLSGGAREGVEGEQPLLGCCLRHCIIPGRIPWDSVSCLTVVVSQPWGRWDGSSRGPARSRAGWAERPGAGSSRRKRRVWSLEMGGLERSVQLTPFRHRCGQSCTVAWGAVPQNHRITE